jgi:hypothetical protein
MAKMFPTPPIGTAPPEAMKVAQRLRRLPDDAFTIWQHLSIWAEPGPDFWVLGPQQRAAFIKVSTATPQDVRNARQASLFVDAPAASFGAAEQDAVCAFAAALAALGQPDLLAQVPAIVVFPNIAATDLRAAALAVLPPGISWAAKEDLAPERFQGWLEAQLGAPLSAAQIEALRRAFTPEVIVPAHLTVRSAEQRQTGAQLTDFLLSYDQEWVLKTDLSLADEALALPGALGLQLVHGVAGSGKSLIVVYRARLLRQFFPHKRILVLTHNKPLILDLQARYHRLQTSGPPIEWHTFYSWCATQWSPGEPWRKPIGARRRRPIVAQAWRAHLADTAISERMLEEEIDWVKDRLITSRQEYLAADRTGRGFGLNGALRQRMYRAVAAYQHAMTEQGLFDYGDVPRGIWRQLTEGIIAPPPYDFILVDEAQFFAPIWFEILKRILNPASGRLFMVADPTQGFLKRRQSWLASGLDVRGHTQRLDRSYRTTRAILDFATRMYQLRLPSDDEALIAPAVQEMEGGTPPQIIRLTSEQDETTRIVNEIRALRESGVPLEHILVLHASWQGVERVLARLRAEFGPAAAVNPKTTAPGRHIRVCTLNAATGLESPIVFVMGTHALCEAEQSVRLSAEERTELIRENTRKLYMAFTRAGQRLALTYVGELPPVFRQLGASAQ